MSAAVANPPGPYFVGHPTHPEEQREPHPVDNQNAPNVQASGAYYSAQPLGFNAVDGANAQVSGHGTGNLTQPSTANGKKKQGSFAKFFSGCFSSGEVAN